MVFLAFPCAFMVALSSRLSYERSSRPAASIRRYRTRRKIPAGLHVTPRGLVWGGGVTFAATSGQLAVIVLLLINAEFAPGWIILVVGGFAGLVLVVYAIKSTVQNLDVGSVPPEAEKTTTTTGEATTVRATVAGAPRHAAIF
jgi:hypothetical protein